MILTPELIRQHLHTAFQVQSEQLQLRRELYQGQPHNEQQQYDQDHVHGIHADDEAILQQPLREISNFN